MASLRATALFGACFVAFLVSGGSPTGGQALDDLDQNWTLSETDTWYDATQGSRLIPLSWFQALEQPDATEPFLADAFIAKFRYLPRTGKLPVGFAIDNSDDEMLSVTKLRWKDGQTSKENWVGFNCAACHTSELSFGQTNVRVEGGTTLADFQGFMEAFDSALVQTRDDAQKFGRFADHVLGSANTPSNAAMLKTALGQLIDWETKIQTMNATDLRYGFGRLDAFGHIYNKVALVVDAANPIPNPANAPVSYPALWNVPQENWVQWNGMAPNHILPAMPVSQPFDIGALMRNTGEAIGVFADVKAVANAPLTGYKSSIQSDSLISLEQMLNHLRPPAWPKDFGALDASLVAKGKTLYAANCQTCHALMDRSDLSTPITIVQSPLSAIATDPWMACNADMEQNETGVLNGTPTDYFGGAALGADAPLSDMLTLIAVGTLVEEKGNVLKSAAASFFGLQPPPVVVHHMRPEVTSAAPQSLSPKQLLLQRCLTGTDRILGYKARPLNGIWATAPYLHNGSVPTLYDLLLPPDQRPKSFWMGARIFDPVKVGFVTAQSPDNSFLFQTRDAKGAVIDGNSNAGHDYGTGLDDDDRKALVEFMKSL